MQPVSTLTALDILNIRPVKGEGGRYHHACPSCGSPAWSGSSYAHCSNRRCVDLVMTPLDMVASALDWDHRKACMHVNSVIGSQVCSAAHANESRIFWKIRRTWLAAIRKPYTMACAALCSYERRNGRTILPDQTGVAVLGQEGLASIVAMAKETGGMFPPQLEERMPEACLAALVQPNPMRVDRIDLYFDKKCVSIVWRRRSSGIVGLLGVTPGAPRLCAPDIHRALVLQTFLTVEGEPQEVAFVSHSSIFSVSADKWRPDGPMLRLVTWEPENLVPYSNALACFPGLENHVVSRSFAGMTAIRQDTDPSVSWSATRLALLAASIRPEDKHLSLASRRLFEQSFVPDGDVTKLAAWFMANGRAEIADSIIAQAGEHVIGYDKGVTIRETLNAYTADLRNGSRSSVATFSLKFTHSHMFPSTGQHHVGSLMFGKHSVPISIRRSDIFNVRALEDAVQSAAMLKHGALECMPAIVDASLMKKHVMLHLQRKVASLPTVTGAEGLGWNNDKTEFKGPSLSIDMSGRTHAEIPFHPGVQATRLLKPGGLEWSPACPPELPQPAQDLVAMILAMAVRYYVGGAMKPLLVRHSAEARALLGAMFGAIGQQAPFEISVNARDPGNFGVRGYPFLCSNQGVSTFALDKYPYVVLHETGFAVGACDEESLGAAGRALQFGLVRVVEWCIATGAEEFSEVPATTFPASLLREGKWLMEHVCELQPWEVSEDRRSGVEALLEMIPAEHTEQRMTLEEGVVILINTKGLDVDYAALAEDFKALGIPYEHGEGYLRISAANFLPVLEQFYGKLPAMGYAATTTLVVDGTSVDVTASRAK